MVPNFFSPPTPNTIGIDISSDSVKLLELSYSGDRHSVECFALVPLPAGTIVEKIIKNTDALADSIRKVVEKSETGAKHVAIAMPDSFVITKVIQMDASLSEEEIENQIVVEADKYIPYPLEEVSLDFQILGPSSKDSDSIDLLLAASRSENVYARVHAIEDAGLTVRVVDIESFAMERACTLITNQLPNS